MSHDDPIWSTTITDNDSHARSLDDQDPLASFRERFYRREGTIYLDGNSLGLLCREAEESTLRVLREWRDLAVDGWLDGNPAWYGLAERVASQAAPLIGAAADEVAIANSTTVNLHQLLATLFSPGPVRNTILADAIAFPSDIYALRSHLAARGLNASECLRLVKSRDGVTLSEDDIVEAMTSDVALCVLPSVQYTSGQLLDMERLAAAAHSRSILIGFDCSHSIGAVPHELDRWGVDFAFWCHYKYLNGGPGAIGGLYLNRRHFDRQPGLAGWFGSRRETQFDMRNEFDPAPDAGRLQIGTPGILSLAPLEGALSVVKEAGMGRLRRKSLDLTDYLFNLCDSRLARFGVRIVTPREHSRRGGHVALAHPDAVRICKALKQAGIIPDFRPPDIVRLAPAPLYCTFSDCYRAVTVLEEIMKTGRHLAFSGERGLVA